MNCNNRNNRFGDSIGRSIQILDCLIVAVKVGEDYFCAFIAEQDHVTRLPEREPGFLLRRFDYQREDRSVQILLIALLQFDFSNLLNLFLATNVICDIFEMLTQAGAKRIKILPQDSCVSCLGACNQSERGLNGGVSAESARGGNLPGFHSLPGTGPCP